MGAALKNLGYFLLGVGSLGVVGLFVLARLELRRLTRSARRELGLKQSTKAGGVARDVARELLEQARGAAR